MPSSAIHAQLMAAIRELQRDQCESNRDATFGGWTRDAEAAHHRRADRMAALCRVLDSLAGVRQE
jgi:hypothetical protein